MVCKRRQINPLKQIVLKLLWHQFLILLFAVGFADIIDFGMPPADDGSLECSRTCQSEYCSEPPLLKYGKFCGVSYTGCPGETPCDDVDACCMFHDSCVAASNDDYLSTVCNENLLSCLGMVKKAGQKMFEGNTCSAEEVSDVISSVVEAAVVAKRVLNKP
ncbi:phospholipase A2-alpha [Carex littledalei]|uniref:phospholipase A2 n=1 Tax=Carex littledalei TaxID=544730 RepID=A0A833QKE6_9POAL|nr:phospholipase A2-alpha [Carex littledalei]